MGSKLDLDPSTDFFQQDPTSSVCIILLAEKWTNRETNCHENNISLAKVNLNHVFIGTFDNIKGNFWKLEHTDIWSNKC